MEPNILTKIIYVHTYNEKQPKVKQIILKARDMQGLKILVISVIIH